MGTKAKRGFTLIELLITITIIGIMAGMVLFALYRAQESARAHKTRALIAKLDAIIKDKWQTYQYRRLPVDLGGDRYDDSTGSVVGQYDSGDQLLNDWNGNGNYDPMPPSPQLSAKMRLDALRDLMRMELPDRWADVADAPMAPFGHANPVPRTAVNQKWFVQYNTPNPVWSDEYQNAECLYLIVMSMLASDDDARDVFKPDNIGDVDVDGAKEFIDAWGMPIRFLRWPAGFRSDLQTVAMGYATASGNSVIVTPVRGQLSTAPGAYVGGVIAVVDKSSTAVEKPIMGDRMARITGYANGVFTCSAFSQPPNNEPVVIMAPDPFDPTGACQTGFAVYPLIYSAGPNKCYGIASDFSPPLHYASTQTLLNPFVRDTSNTLIGTPKELAGEPHFVPNGWLDNIHNHAIGLR